MTGRKKFALQLPQMEYTRFPWAANEPPRADALRPGKGCANVGLPCKTFARGLWDWDCAYSSYLKHLLPQDKEGYGSDTSHAEKAIFFFEESRIFHLLT